MEMENKKELKKELGLIIATALVAGNMMGSGIFMLPATLAAKSGSGATMLAWLITGVGSIFLALSFANLGSKIPKTGGPYEYSKMAFGDFMGFMNAWLYWNGGWIGNAAILTAVASYTASVCPLLNTNHTAAFIYTSAILWIFTFINILGVKKAGIVQTAVTIFEILLFVFFLIITVFNFHISYLEPVFPKGMGMSTVPTAASATLWAFIGFETASVAAGEIKNPEKNVKKSTIYGILIVLVLYMLINLFAMGAMPHKDLANSQSPIVDILSIYLGKKIADIILIGCVISVLGTTIGWILATARMSYAVGVDKMFPQIFAKVHPKYKTPYASLIICAVLVNILLLMNYNKSLVSAFNFIILLAALAYLPMYACTAAAEIVLLAKRDKNMNVFKFIKNSIVPLLGFAYATWAIYGSGAETVMYGFILILSGVPFYLYARIKRESTEEVLTKVM
jgi:amino acid transporter